MDDTDETAPAASVTDAAAAEGGPGSPRTRPSRRTLQTTSSSKTGRGYRRRNTVLLPHPPAPTPARAVAPLPAAPAGAACSSLLVAPSPIPPPFSVVVSEAASAASPAIGGGAGAEGAAGVAELLAWPEQKNLKRRFTCKKMCVCFWVCFLFNQDQGRCGMFSLWTHNPQPYRVEHHPGQRSRGYFAAPDRLVCAQCTYACCHS